MSAYLTYCKEIEGKPYKIIPNVVKLKTQIKYTMAKNFEHIKIRTVLTILGLQTRHLIFCTE